MTYPIRQLKQSGADGVPSINQVFDKPPLVGSTIFCAHHTGAADSQLPNGFTERLTLTNTTEVDEGALYTKLVQAGSITGATKANPCSITETAHGKLTGDTVYIDNVGGMVELNGASYVITKTGDDTYTLDGINSTAFTTYTSGGTSVQMNVKVSSNASDENMAIIFEVPGEWHATITDQVSTGSRQSSTSSYAIPGTGTTVQANELAIAVLIQRTNTLNNVSAWSNTFIGLAQQNSGNAKGLAVAYKRLVSTQTVSTTATMITANTCMGGIVTFKRNTGTVPTPPTEMRLWKELTTSTLSSIDPEDNASTNINHPSDAPYHGSGGQPGVIDAWCGAVIRQNGSICEYWIGPGGGHGDYYGNELYKLNIIAATPTWVLARDPFNATIPLNETDGMYASGEPASRHTYNYGCYDADNDEMLVPGAHSIAGPSAVGSSNFLNYDFSGDTWSESTYTDLATGLAPTQHAFDIGDGRVVIIGVSGTVWGYLDKNTNTYTTFNPGATNLAGCSCWDSKRERVVVIGHSATQVGFYDPNVGGAFKLLTVTSAPTGMDDDTMGILYDTARDRYVCWAGGQTLHDLDPDTLVFTTRSLPTQSVTPTNPAPNGTFNRWAYINPRTEYPDGAYIIVNDTEESTYLFGEAGELQVNISDSNHAQTADNIVLTQAHVLSIDNTAQNQSSDNIGLIQSHLLTVENTTHIQTAEAPTITQLHIISVDNAGHAQSAALITLTQAHTLQSDDSAHSQQSDNIVLDVGVVLSVADTSHAQSAESIQITQSHLLSIDNVIQSQNSENISVSQVHFILMSDALHAQIAENIALTQLHVLALDNNVINQLAGNIVLTQQHSLDIQNTNHAQNADNIVLVTGALLGINDVLHAQEGENITLTQVHLLLIDDTQHNQFSDNIALTQSHILITSDTQHSQLSENITLDQSISLTVQNTSHSQSAENIVLSYDVLLEIQNAVHSLSGENIVITQAHVLVVDDTLHAQIASGLSIQAGTIVTIGPRTIVLHSRKNTVIILKKTF